MVSSMKERYEELKKCGNILLNYDEILLFYPDYFKTKVELEKESFISKELVDDAFEKSYRDSALYDKLVQLAMANDEIHDFMKHNKNLKYASLKRVFEKLVQSSIDLCELIDYIGHYPTTYPVPKEEEKNSEMEELLEKYDIIVRYYLGDIDKMQITSDDVVRIIDKLHENLEMINAIKEIVAFNDWLFTRQLSDEEREKDTNDIINSIDSFPLSTYQKQNQSSREEGKKYLRLQHGKNII